MSKLLDKEIESVKKIDDNYIYYTPKTAYKNLTKKIRIEQFLQSYKEYIDDFFSINREIKYNEQQIYFILNEEKI